MELAIEYDGHLEICRLYILKMFMKSGILILAISSYQEADPLTSIALSSVPGIMDVYTLCYLDCKFNGYQ